MIPRIVRASTLIAVSLALSAASTAWGDSANSHIGKLNFEVGYPKPETARRLYDELDFQRATQAYIWALPAVGFHSLHLALQNSLSTPDGQIALFRDLKDKTGMLTPNITTIYAMSFWNLSLRGPLVIEVPEGATAGGVLDFWQRPITDIGQTGPDKGMGAKYLILPPGKDEVQADGYIVVRSPTNKIWIATRGLDPDPRAAEALLRKHRLYAWDKRQMAPETNYVAVGGRPWMSTQPRDSSYWIYLHDVLQGEPTDDRDRFFMAMLKPLGLDKDKAFDPDDRQQKILADAAVVGDAMARTISYNKRLAGSAVYPGKHWDYANLVELTQDADDASQLDERASWFFEAIGNSAGMQGRTVGFGQVYLEASKDSNGKWLDGGKTYRLRVPAKAPVKQFWSITLYDNQTRGPLVAQQGAADMSSRGPLQKNADGSIDLYFGPKKHRSANANWIQTLPGKGWFAYFRLYAPTEAYFDKEWKLNDIEPIK